MAHDAENTAIVIRPMGIGEVLDAGFSLARRHFRLLVTITAWGVIPGQALGAVFLAAAAGLEEISITTTLTLATLLSQVFTGVGTTLAFFALQIASVKLIDPEATPVPLRVWPLYRSGLSRMFFWAIFVLGLTIIAIPLMILFPVGIWLAVRWSMMTIPFLVERAGPIASLKRSWMLTSGNWWHTALVLFVTGLIVSVLQGAVGMVLGLGGVVVGGLSGEVVGTLVTALAMSLAAVVFTPFSVAIYSVLYYELRARAEGYDLAQRAQQLATSNE